jgi:hypothetical protein
MRPGITLILLVLLAGQTIAQVNLQNGAAEQSFPLVNYMDSKAGLSMNIGLGYSSGNGLLVNDIASNVGTGWNLDAGGIIVRIQNGQPDDQREYYSGRLYADKDDAGGVNQVVKSYPNGYLYNPNIGRGCNEGLNFYPSFKHQSVYKERNLVAGDVEQDKFIFRMNGRSGMFVIGRDSKVTIVGDSRVKVSFSTVDMTAQGIRTTINSFTIITEDGIKYTFNEKSLSNICRYKYSTRDGYGNWYAIWDNPSDDAYAVNRFWGYKLNADERPFVVSSWFLSEIENTNTGQKIRMSYENVYNDVISGKSLAHQRDLNKGPGGNAREKKRGKAWFNFLTNPVNAASFQWNINELNKVAPSSTSLIYNRSVIQSKRISNISFPDGAYVYFTYNPVGRVDLPGENALSRIDYVIAGKLVRGYKMEYGYFFKNAIRPYTYAFSGFESKFARLCLLSLQKVGNGEDNAAEPPYKFAYYTGSTHSSDDLVPAQNYLSQDHWGYYNGNNSGLPLSEDHDFLSDERTQYFKPVLASYRNPKNGYAKNGLLMSVTYPTGGSLTYYYEQNRPSQNILPTNYEQMAGGVSAVKAELFDGGDYSKTVVKEYRYKAVNETTSSRWGDEAPVYSSLSMNKYDLKCFNGRRFKYPGLEYPELAVSIDWPKIIGKALLSAAIGAGIQYGIAAVLTSVGLSSWIPVVNIIIFVAAIVKIIFDCLKEFEYYRFTLTNQNFMQSNPMGGFYSRVDVRSNSPTGYNGKTIYEFTDTRDYAPLMPKLEWPYLQQQRLAGWAYGLTKKVTVYDKDNRLVKESANTYATIVEKLANSNNFNCKCETQKKYVHRADDWQDYDRTHFSLGTIRDMTPRPYFIFTGRSDLSSISENTYANGQLFFQSATSIIVDPMTLLQKGTIMQKDVGSLILSITYYPTDFTIGGALQQLKDRNAIQVPVSTETWQLKINRTFPHLFTLEMIGANVTEFKQYTFGARQEVKPWRMWELKTKAPIPSSVIGAHNPALLIRAPQYYKLLNELFYDSDGNLVQTTSDEYNTSYVNDYSSRFKVATVVNATAADISYTSFEANGKGGWNFDPSFIKTNNNLTGLKSFKLGLDASTGQTSTITRTGLDAAKTYVITYWLRNAKPDNAQVNGQGGESMYSLPDGWTLYKHEVTGVTQVTITGDAVLDELRLYPKGAMMNTVAIKEGIGKITDCDANNRLLFYEYDALGRLKIIRDQNRNIIKTYEYNYIK